MSSKGILGKNHCLVENLQRNDLVIAQGQHTTVAASDTVATGLRRVLAVLVQLDSDPSTDPDRVTATPGDQAGTPVAGSVLIKTWKPTATADTAPVAATTFSKVVNWIALGY